MPTAVHGWAGRNNWTLEIPVAITSFPKAERLLVIPEILAGVAGIASNPYKAQAESRVSVAV